jgi:hypothetical protein
VPATLDPARAATAAAAAASRPRSLPAAGGESTAMGGPKKKVVERCYYGAGDPPAPRAPSKQMLAGVVVDS